MKAYTLKPLKWQVQGPYMLEVTTPLHHYHCRYSPKEGCYITYYSEFATDESGTHYSRTLGEAAYWIENTHLPDKLLNWFKGFE